MEIPFDHFGGRLTGLAAKADIAAGPVPLDWPGLAARLAATHAARRVLTDRPRPADGAAGSFSPGVARDLAAWRAAASDEQSNRCSSGINLDTKAHGKPPRPIGRSDAGDDRLLVRGLP